MQRNDDGGAAFPHPGATNGLGNVVVYPEHGMTLRDYFAAQAAAALVASGQFLDPSGLFTQNGATAVAHGGYLLADAMLAERAKGDRS